MSRARRSPDRIRRLLALVLATALSVAVMTAAAAGPATANMAKPTVVLVHGAWADSSSWDQVVRRLQGDGYSVDVFPSPLRSLHDDTGYLRDYLATIKGPIVLVGHSYGGAVTTDAATGNPQVKALVYLDAFAPDQGETTLQLAGADSALANPDATQVFRFVPAALPPTPTTDLYVLPSLFRTAFANDLPARKAAVLAATQRPVTLGALGEASSAPAWRTIPSWYEVGTRDRVIPPAQQLFMAKRAGAHIVMRSTGHLPMISMPGAVTRIIEAAAYTTH